MAFLANINHRHTNCRGKVLRYDYSDMRMAGFNDMMSSYMCWEV